MRQGTVLSVAFFVFHNIILIHGRLWAAAPMFEKQEARKAKKNHKGRKTLSKGEQGCACVMKSDLSVPDRQRKKITDNCGKLPATDSLFSMSF